MSVLILLIGVSLTVALVFLLAFLWASISGQYDDDYTPSVRMLFDDTTPTNQPKSHPSTSSKK
ncbi:MAG: cbb3-type cytochrome oxidase assembly protein CcoS [Tunicatimonas sp.]|uniref:cbb3-type cytochrome oxidase assembly protein CcoS n=1 Tax=Tunicatimonas sp. TaxID=1940096 RepID=UPI003C74E0A2